ncbi:MAG: tetratricopeptide repeat protein [Pseudomonadota bacterium]|nr:tetratricopeptide repeat protein [Pseudomonadota bacterium]
MSFIRLHVAAFCAFLLLQGCAHQELPAPETAAPWLGNSALFGERPALPTTDELHRLTAEQQAEFLAWFNDPSRSHQAAHYRLSVYLENKVGTYQYVPETLPAAVVLASNGGNCLSLAMVTTALADLVGIEVSYQFMDDQPVYEYQGSVVIRGNHISAIVKNPDWEDIRGTALALTTSPGIRIDYFPELRGRFLANLDRNGYLALYYDNIASDAIARGDYDSAYWHLREALHLAPEHGASLNMLAIVHRRKGDTAGAERIYQHGIAHADDRLTLLKNYESLLITSGRMAEAAEVRRQLEAIDDTSPLHWLQLARASEQRGDWNESIAYYRRVLQLVPYMHEVHLALAQAYYASGELRRAESELASAVETANRVSARNLYKAKLLTLRKEL